MKLCLMNTTIITNNNGKYEVEEISLNDVKKLIAEHDFISAIGHQATANVLTTMLGVNVELNRVEFSQKINQICICLKLKRRLEEGKVLNVQEIEQIGYSLVKMTRTA